MNNKEQIDQAFAEIDDKLIEWAAKTPKSKKRFWKRLGTVAIAASLLIGISLGAIFLMGKSDSISANGWKIIEYDGTTLKKMKSGINGGHYTLCIDYSSVISDLPIAPKEDLWSELFGQWAVSLLAFDYEQHFALFQEEILKDSVYLEFEENGFTSEQACEKIRQVACDLVDAKKFRLEYSILEFENTPELLQEFIQNFESDFEKAGLDIDRVEEVCAITLDNITVYYQELFLSHGYVDDAAFYKYDGRWYASPYMLEDDICIDLLGSDKESGTGYFRYKQIQTGKVAKIENGYAVLDSIHSTQYFLINEAKISVGDYIKITYYSITDPLIRVSDGVECDVFVISEVEKLNME